MTPSWTAAALEKIGAAVELEIAVARPDGTLRPWTPIWVVVAGPDVFVRTWFPRETGWFGAALRSGRARVRVPGLEIDVLLMHTGSIEATSSVDAAYRTKYGPSGSASADRMCTEQAVATTLRLSPDGDRPGLVGQADVRRDADDGHPRRRTARVQLPPGPRTSGRDGTGSAPGGLTTGSRSTSLARPEPLSE